MIPLSVPCIRGNEWLYVKECLDTEWVSSAGSFVDAFEQRLAEYTGAPYAVACVNGTAALQVALSLVGVQAGDEVLVPTLTFIASVNAIRYLHAEPVFMDCDDYYNIDVEKVGDFLRKETEFRDGAIHNRATGRRVAAVLPVHVFGNAARLEQLLPLCAERALPVVEDAAESLGTFYSSGSLASQHTGTIGDLGCVSFNGNKIVTTGGGGMILTADRALAERARYLTTQAKDDDVRFVHNEVGYNFRLTNLQAAVGLAQMEQLPGFLEAKRRQYEEYRSQIEAIPGLHLAAVPPYASNNHWMHCLQIDDARYREDREAVMQRLAGHGIQTRPVWRLNHLQVPYAGCQSYRIEKATALSTQTLNLPCSVNLTSPQIQAVIGQLR